MNLKYNFAYILALFSILNGVVIQAIPADVDVYFVPKDIDEINKLRIDFFNKTKKQLLVAVYWITDKTFISQLADLKQRGVDVQVIFDFTTPNNRELINSLVDHDIIPVVSSFSDVECGIMHNKFLVSDNKNIWTGSANFTGVVFNPQAGRSNDENIITINSAQISNKYSKAFAEMEDTILSAYIQFIADSDELTYDWLEPLVRKLYQYNSKFKELVRNSVEAFNAKQIKRLSRYFPDIAMYQTKSKPASYSQLSILREKGVNVNQPLSYDEAYQMIGELFEQEGKKQTYAYVKPASQTQLSILRARGVDVNRPLSYDEAYKIIGGLLPQESSQERKRKRFDE